MSLSDFEESIPLLEASEDSHSEHYFRPPFTDRQRHLPSQLSASPAVLKKLLSFVLVLILSAAISIAFIPQLAQRKFDADLDRQCAMHTSEYCELNYVQCSPELLSYPMMPPPREKD